MIQVHNLPNRDLGPPSLNCDSLLVQTIKELSAVILHVLLCGPPRYAKQWLKSSKKSPTCNYFAYFWGPDAFPCFRSAFGSLHHYDFWPASQPRNSIQNDHPSLAQLERYESPLLPRGLLPHRNTGRCYHNLFTKGA